MEEMRSHAELREELIGKAAADHGFRSVLLADPRAAIKEALGLDLPESVSVQVHEASAPTRHVVLPPPANLSEEELEMAAGGHLVMGGYMGTKLIQHDHYF